MAFLVGQVPYTDPQTPILKCDSVMFIEKHKDTLNQVALIPIYIVVDYKIDPPSRKSYLQSEQFLDIQHALQLTASHDLYTTSTTANPMNNV